jgi:hypothetical protein
MTARTDAKLASNRVPLDIWGAPAIFFTFAIAGCAYIVLAKQFGVRQGYVTFVPVGFMLAYAAFIYLARFLRLRDDQAGDNLYYMGFLFTLTSLGASLYQFSASGDAEYIVQNFGIAIASTIAGIAMRVMFNQMRRDPAEVERVARLELAEAARRVRIELDHTVLEFNHFRRAAQQSIQEGFAEVGTHVEQVSQKLLSNLEEVTSKSAAPLEAASRNSGNTIEEVTKTMVAALQNSAQQLASENERLSKSAADIAGSLDNVSNRLAAMQAPEEVIQIKLDPTIKGLASAVDRFTKRIDQHEQVVGAALESARLSSEATREAVNSIKSGTSNVETSFGNAVKSLAAAIASFETASGTQSERLAAVLKHSDEAMGRLKGIAAELAERDRKSYASSPEDVAAAQVREPTPVTEAKPIVIEAYKLAPQPASELRRKLWPVRSKT